MPNIVRITKRIVALAGAAILFAIPIDTYAQAPNDYDTRTPLYESCETEQVLELRARATIQKELPHGFTIGFRQDIRARMLDKTYEDHQLASSESPYLRRLYTRLSLDYSPIEYVDLHAAYMLRILSDKWHKQPADYLQHRVMVGITGQYKYRQWKFALMEQLDIDCRMDSPDPRVAPKASLLLRHAAKVDYAIAGTPLQLKSKVELHNTLNQPTAYLNQIDGHHYHQYLTSARAEIGLRWKINARHALTLTYRYLWDYKRSLTLPAADFSPAYLIHTRTHSHIIQLAYDLAFPQKPQPND